MARTLNKFSALKVSRLTTPGLYCDGEGLWLQVSPSGSKSWVYRYTIASRRHHMGLGSPVNLAGYLRESNRVACRYRCL
jgi:hypothetical protein